MAQMFSSGVTPDYLKALSDAYAQYFPQQAPVNTQALQQWYSPSVPSGSSAFAAPLDTSATPSSVVGSLFGDQYPQVHQGTRGSGSPADSNPAWSAMSDAQKANFYANNPGWGAFNQGVQNMFGNTTLGMLQNKFFPDFVQNQKMISMGITPNPQGTLADVGIVNQVQDPMQAAMARESGGGYGNFGGFAGADGVGRSAPGSAHGE